MCVTEALVGACRALNSYRDFLWGHILCPIFIATLVMKTERDWLRVFGAGSCIYSLLTLVRPPRDGGDRGDDGAKDVQMAPLVEVERETVVVAFDFDKCLMTRHWYVTMHNHLHTRRA